LTDNHLLARIRAVNETESRDIRVCSLRSLLLKCP
jgi:hypothetical protein